MAFPVSSHTALITGGSSGIGFSLTNLLLSKGCNVLIVDLQIKPEVQAVIDESKGAKVRAAFFKADVTVWAELKAAFDAAIREFGRLDIVVPGAGIFEPSYSSFWHPLTSKETTSWATLDINISHPLKATQLALDSFKAQKFTHGTVVLISSIAAQMELLPYPLYAASKAAISSFIRSMGPLEEFVGYRVVGVAPGIVQTPIWTPEKLVMFEEEKGDLWVTPRQVAEVMVDLVEKEQYVGGTILEIGSETVRSVKGLNDPGPSGKGLGVSGAATAAASTFQAFEEQFGK